MAEKKRVNLNDPKECTKYWTEYAAKRLVGRRITKVEYLNSKDCKNAFGWYKRPVTFTLDNGKVVIAQMDDEGNDGGVLLIEYPGETVSPKWANGEKFLKTEVLPVLSLEDE